MSSTSNTSVYRAQVSRKPENYYTSRPPTAHPTDKQHLRAYRLSSYSQDSHRPLMASSQSAAQIQGAHQARAGQQIDDFSSRFY